VVSAAPESSLEARALLARATKTVDLRAGDWSDPRFSRHIESVFSLRATLSVISV